MSSPPEFITPPGSERSLSGEGKDTMTAETTSTEQTQKVLHQNIPQNITKICWNTLILISSIKALREFAMGDMYRQKFSCEICHKTFTRKYSLSRHYKEVHQGESRSSKFQCKFQKDNNEKIIFKGSPYSSHFIFEIKLGKRRIRHRTTLDFIW